MINTIKRIKLSASEVYETRTSLIHSIEIDQDFLNKFGKYKITIYAAYSKDGKHDNSVKKWKEIISDKIEIEYYIEIDKAVNYGSNR